MTTKTEGMLLACKNGNISAAKFISETPNAWILKIEKRIVEVSKSSSWSRAFKRMSDALRWAGAEPELIAHFDEAGTDIVEDQHASSL